MAPLARVVLVEDLGRVLGLLTRGDRQDIQEARRVVTSMRRELAPAPAVFTDDTEEREQFVLPLRMLPDSVVADCPLSCPPQRLAAPTALCCAARQLANQIEVGAGPAKKRSSRAKRGRVGKFVTCRTELCPVGARVRLLLGDRPEARAMAERAPKASDTSE